MSRWRLWALVGVLLAGCQSTPRSHEAVIYVPSDAIIFNRAVEAIVECFSHPDCEALLGDRLTCGPFLWSEIKNHPAVANNTNVLLFTIPEHTEDGTARDVSLQGRVFRGTEQVRAFWKAFTDIFPLESHAKVRTLSDEECRIYWTLIRDKIQEPVFMVYGENANILVQLAGVRHRLTMTFIDDFGTVAIEE